MIYVHEVAVLQSLQYAEYEALTLQHVIPPLAAYGAHALGIWYTIIGCQDEVVTLTHYRDLGHWDQVSRALASEPAVTEALARRSDLCLEETSKLMVPSALVQPAEFDLDGRSVFANRTLTLRPGAWADYERLTATEMWPRLRTRGIEPVGLWRTIAGRHNEADILTQYTSLGAWEASHPARGVGTEDGVTDVRERRQRLLLREHVRLMRPGRYRPSVATPR